MKIYVNDQINAPYITDSETFVSWQLVTDDHTSYIRRTTPGSFTDDHTSHEEFHGVAQQVWDALVARCDLEITCPDRVGWASTESYYDERLDAQLRKESRYNVGDVVEFELVGDAEEGRIESISDKGICVIIDAEGGSWGVGIDRIAGYAMHDMQPGEYVSIHDTGDEGRIVSYDGMGWYTVQPDGEDVVPVKVKRDNLDWIVPF